MPARAKSPLNRFHAPTVDSFFTGRSQSGSERRGRNPWPPAAMDRAGFGGANPSPGATFRRPCAVESFPNSRFGSAPPPIYFQTFDSICYRCRQPKSQCRCGLWSPFSGPSAVVSDLNRGTAANRSYEIPITERRRSAIHGVITRALPAVGEGDNAPKGLGTDGYKPLMRNRVGLCVPLRNRDTAGNTFGRSKQNKTGDRHGHNCIGGVVPLPGRLMPIHPNIHFADGTFLSPTTPPVLEPVRPLFGRHLRIDAATPPDSVGAGALSPLCHTKS